MATNSTTARILVPTREEQVSKYKRDYLLRDPSASVVVMEQVDVDARVLADQLLPVMDAARSAGDALTNLNQVGDDIDRVWEPRGIPRLKAIGASGFVRISASSGGGPIFFGDELKDPDTQLRFQCLETNLSYQDGDSVPIGGVDTGPATNLAIGKKLVWSTNRPGIGPNAIVLEQGDGDGLTGGREKETDDEYLERIEDYQANPAAAGNSAQIALTVERTTGVAVQKAFVYPAIKGSCTAAVAFVLKSTSTGSSRIPSELQRSTAEAFLYGEMPGGDIYYFPTLVAEPQDITCEVRWAKGAVGWTDTIQWPPRVAPGSGQYVITGTPTSSTAFSIRTDDNDYVGTVAPQPGNTIGFYDSGRRKFSRKRIATVTGTGPWAITCTTTNGASDTAYTPETGQPCCPWSDSLDLLVAPMLKAFNGLGPGEMVASVDFLLDGQRQRRVPETSTSWPSTLTNKSLVSAFDIQEVADIAFTEGADTTAPVGDPGVIVYLITPGTLTAFPKALA